MRRAVGALAVEVHPDEAALARSAARDTASRIRDAISARGEANVMFATGNSQLGFVSALVGETVVEWSGVRVFHMDEYVGVSSDHKAGFQRWIRERISDRTDPGAAYYIDGMNDPAEECARYSALLRQHTIDVCCLGIGENGHLAFNDPGIADFEDPADVKVVELDEACRRQQVGEGHFPDLASVPPLAITVTVPALLRSRHLIAVVPERRKAAAVRQALEGPISTACPASALRNCANAVLYLDSDSASLLSRP